MDRNQRKAILIVVAIAVVGLAGMVGLGWYGMRHFGEISAEMPEIPEPDRRGELATLQGKLATEKDEYMRWVELPTTALLCARFGDPVQARAYVDELQALAPKYERDWNYGNATHKAQLAIGHLALRAGDVAAARQALLAAGDTRGSPQLDTFGPTMTLAKDLLAKGERDTVLAYIDKLGRFWKMDNGALAKWSAMIRAGRTPNFGANLVY